ncbi:MAG: SNF2-related protein, partial [Pseudomonadota bacterium]
IGVGVPWYIDTEDLTCGPVDTGVSKRISQLLLSAPAVPASAATAIRQKLQVNGAAIPLPEPLRRRERVEIKPTPCIHFHSPRITAVRGAGWNREESEVDLPLARVSFDYSGAEVGWQDGRSEINHVSDNRLLVIPRDALAEVQYIERLNLLDLQPLGPTGLGRFAPEHCRQDFTFEEDDDDDVSFRWVEFNNVEIPKLEANGWRVSYADDYPFRIARPSSTWHIEITENGIDWFDLNVGIEIDGDRVELLPLLLDLFERAPEEMSPAALEAFGDAPIYGSLPDGRLVPIPASRLKAMLAALYELFAEGRLQDEGALRLSRSEVCRLETLREKMPEDALEWSGGERLRSLARQLAQLTDIPEVDPPKGLRATLRNYQYDGLRWLQFLSSASLSGVLADDMGLGKTLQTLAHMLLEKEASKLLLPCLVVAPTSLIPTWRNEARRFAPDLDVLVLHGTDRQDLFDEIEDHDLIITSYALMLRDRGALIKHRYQMVVLDEAQAIKNPGTKLAKTACELEAEHKIALSGTPIENHLGELWSVFHFLMPGYLGDRETFRRVFRNQIEKQGDLDRQALLVSRVRPFLLRRTKEDVASELPPKSEVIREIELAGPQRDLYESVRVAMSKRVRDEIAENGLSRSSITILDALLKLRQVCC